MTMSRPRSICSTFRVLLAFPIALAVANATAVAAQVRRAAPVQPVSEVERGDVLLGLGVNRSWGGHYALSGFSGDLLGIGALFQIRGLAHQRLTIRERRSPSVPLDPSTEDGISKDAGDFRVSTSFAPIGGRLGFSAGALVEVKLPNTDHEKGIGPNTTDVAVSLIGSWGSERFRGTGALGIAILAVPLQNQKQNDLVSYAADLVYRTSDRLRLSLGVAGLANLLEVAPLGTESRGAISGAAEWAVGDWRLDLGVQRGVAGGTPDWTIAAGVAWVASGGSQGPDPSFGSTHR
jgi:hypothetical protein